MYHVFLAEFDPAILRFFPFSTSILLLFTVFYSEFICVLSYLQNCIFFPLLEFQKCILLFLCDIYSRWQASNEVLLVCPRLLGNAGLRFLVGFF